MLNSETTGHVTEGRNCPICHRVCRFVKSAKSSEVLTLTEEYRLKSENKRIRAQLDDVLSGVEKESGVHGFVESIMRAPMGEVPQWVREPPAGKRNGTPTAFLSDTHFGENVFPDQIEQLNGYSRAIAEERLKRFFLNASELARDYIKGINYPGIVLALGGDMFSGDIHEELARTNAGTIQEEVLHWIPPMLAGIRSLADEFGRVYIPSVVGNHPRGTPKPTAKMRAPNNFDWLFAQLLKMLMAEDKRVSFNVARSADIDYSVYGTRYRLSHGDQFRGGSGIAGLLSPLMIGDARKRKRAAVSNQGYDWLVLGHWHQYSVFKRIIVNGSLKGYDEYAYLSNFEFEPPRQAFWITDPRHGVTITAPIHVQGSDEPWMCTRQQAVAFASAK